MKLLLTFAGLKEWKNLLDIIGLDIIPLKVMIECISIIFILLVFKD